MPEPESAIETPAEIVSATPPAAAPSFSEIRMPDESHFPRAAGVPPPPTVAGEMRMSQALPGVPPKGDFFAPD